jgi:hypothetical protein
MSEREGPKDPHEPMIDKEISMLAFCYWEERSRTLRSAEVDWHRASREINLRLDSHAVLKNE